MICAQDIFDRDCFELEHSLLEPRPHLPPKYLTTTAPLDSHSTPLVLWGAVGSIIVSSRDGADDMDTSHK